MGNQSSVDTLVYDQFKKELNRPVTRTAKSKSMIIEDAGKLDDTIDLSLKNLERESIVNDPNETNRINRASFNKEELLGTGTLEDFFSPNSKWSEEYEKLFLEQNVPTNILYSEIKFLRKRLKITDSKLFRKSQENQALENEVNLLTNQFQMAADNSKKKGVPNQDHKYCNSRIKSLQEEISHLKFELFTATQEASQLRTQVSMLKHSSNLMFINNLNTINSNTLATQDALIAEFQSKDNPFKESISELSVTDEKMPSENSIAENLKPSFAGEVRVNLSKNRIDRMSQSLVSPKNHGSVESKKFMAPTSENRRYSRENTEESEEADLELIRGIQNPISPKNHTKDKKSLPELHTQEDKPVGSHDTAATNCECEKLRHLLFLAKEAIDELRNDVTDWQEICGRTEAEVRTLKKMVKHQKIKRVGFNDVPNTKMYDTDQPTIDMNYDKSESSQGHLRSISLSSAATTTANSTTNPTDTSYRATKDDHQTVGILKPSSFLNQVDHSQLDSKASIDSAPELETEEEPLKNLKAVDEVEKKKIKMQTSKNPQQLTPQDLSYTIPTSHTPLNPLKTTTEDTTPKLETSLTSKCSEESDDRKAKKRPSLRTTPDHHSSKRVSTRIQSANQKASLMRRSRDNSGSSATRSGTNQGSKSPTGGCGGKSRHYLGTVGGGGLKGGGQVGYKTPENKGSTRSGKSLNRKSLSISGVKGSVPINSRDIRVMGANKENCFPLQRKNSSSSLQASAAAAEKSAASGYRSANTRRSLNFKEKGAGQSGVGFSADQSSSPSSPRYGTPKQLLGEDSHVMSDSAMKPLPRLMISHSSSSSMSMKGKDDMPSPRSRNDNDSLSRKAATGKKSRFLKKNSIDASSQRPKKSSVNRSIDGSCWADTKNKDGISLKLESSVEFSRGKISKSTDFAAPGFQINFSSN